MVQVALFGQFIPLTEWLCSTFDSYIIAMLEFDGQSKITRVRMQNGLSKQQDWNRIEFYFGIPDHLKAGRISLFADTKTVQDIIIKDIIVKGLSR